MIEAYPSVTCVAGHSIGGLWAVEFCRDLHAAGKWPSDGLDFFYMGVHGKGLSLAPFKDLTFGKVGYAIASEDGSMQRAAEGDVPGWTARTLLELPPSCTVFEIAGGDHQGYGSYGSPGIAQVEFIDYTISMTTH